MRSLTVWVGTWWWLWDGGEGEEDASHSAVIVYRHSSNEQLACF